MSSWLQETSDFVAGFQLAALPQAVVEQASYIVLDTMGAIIGGSAEPEYQAIAKRLVPASRGDALVIGRGERAASATAALLNGMAGTFLEMDEGNRFARGHPAIHILPAAWAAAEARGLSGHALFEAFVVGYEVAARLGTAANLKSTMHPHGTWGTLGAAVAAAKLAGYDAARIAETINVASSLTLASSKKTMLEGGTVRNVYSGVSNQMGLLAVDLVASGFTGEHDGVASVFGSVVSDTFDSSIMTAGLGQEWQVMRNYFKLHACCRYNHAALDALNDLLGLHGALDIASIERIDVSSYRYAAELNDQAPRNTLAGKFSVPFALATRLVTGSSGVASFTWDAIRNQRIQDLAKKIFVTEDPALTAMLPRWRPARIAVSIAGRRLEASVDFNRGDDESPYSRQELDGKFSELARRMLSADVADKLRGELLRLPELASLSGIGQCLAAAVS